MRASSIALALVFSLASATAVACPKGTHPVGGTGPHHKGGKCVATSDEKTAEKAPEAKADSKSKKKHGASKEKKKAEESTSK